MSSMPYSKSAYASLAELALIAMPAFAALLLLFIDVELFGALFRYFGYTYFVLLPASYLASKYFLREVQLTALEGIFLGYPVAVAILCAISFVAKLLDLSALVFLSAAVPSIWLSGLLLRGQRKSTQSKPTPDSWWLSIAGVYAVAVTLFYFLFIVTTADPSTDKPGLYYQDLLWTVGNSESFYRFGIPMQDIRFSGVGLSYHIIQNVYVSYLHTLTAVSIFDLHARILPIFDLYFLVGILAVGAKAFLEFRAKQAVILPLSLLFCAGSWSWLSSGYLVHIYANPLSFFFGLQSFVLLLMLVVIHARRGLVFVPYTALVFLIAAASKASLVLTLIPAFALYTTYSYFQRRNISRDVVMLCVSMAAVVLALKYSIFAGAESGLQSRLDFGGFDALAGAGNGWSLNATRVLYRASGVGGLLRQSFNTFIGVAATTFAIGGVGLALLLKKCDAELVRGWKQYGLFTLFFSVFSIAVIGTFDLTGGEPYFSWYPVIACGVMFAQFVRLCVSSDVARRFRSAAAMLCAVSFGLFLINIMGMWHSPWRQAALGRNSIWDSRATITFHEYEAMNWIRANLPENALMMSDRRGFLHERSGQFVGRFFGYSALTGRRFFCEGDDFNRLVVQEVAERRWETAERLLKTDSSLEAAKLLANTGAEYVLISKRFTTPGAGLRLISRVAFENRDLLVLHGEKSGSGSEN